MPTTTATQLNKPSAACTLEEFSVFYLSLVKSQTDEFIKNNTSTCNTPRKITTSIADNDHSIVQSHQQLTNKGIGTGNNDSDGPNQQLQRTLVNDGSNVGGDVSLVKRQISRELFVNRDDNNSDTIDNRVGVDGDDKMRNNSFLRGSGHQLKSVNQSGNESLSLGENSQSMMGRKMGRNESDISGCNKAPTSTPLNSFNKSNRSFDATPSNTSTPNSFKIQSFEQSSLMNRNNSRKTPNDSSRNTSFNRRNTSSPLCLGDFMSASVTSVTGKNSKKKNSSHLADGASFSALEFPSLGEESSCQQKRNVLDQKPKKRVVPITISRRVSSDMPAFTSSSFQSDNNLLNVSTHEANESDNAMIERRMLKDCKDAISKDFTKEHEPQRNLYTLIKENLPASSIILATPGKVRKHSTLQYDETKVEHKEMLKVMAKIYSFMLDMNLMPNILSELSYLINLLNTDFDPYEQLNDQNQMTSNQKSPNDIAGHILKSLNNCIHFSTLVLISQKHVLALFDVTTIRVLIDNERIQQLAMELYEYLKTIQQRKSQLDVTMTMKMSTHSNNSISSVVFYQQDTDNRDNFPSDREFGAFKKQRDLFYGILRAWEMKHLDPVWDFRKDLGLKVRSLLTLMEHPINMAHLAKLFTAQLIISCNFDNSANELQMVLPNIDLSKLSKLRQRLIAPSLFSTQYLFAGNQAFFRDFIICCDYHMMFMQQLKIALINELMQFNDSSMDTLSITNGNGDDDNKEKTFQQEFIVRAATIATMRVLAKFIGFLVARPYGYDGYRNSLVDQKQSQIRNLLHPDFDVKCVLLRAIDCHKLLVTIPWLVEYLAMLDFITIRLDYYRELFQLLYTLYIKFNVINGNDELCVLPTSKFIVRSCLGWLFEHPGVPEEYYNSSNVKSKTTIDSKAPLRVQCSFMSSDVIQFNPYLEAILTAACPFLADFRVSMMPQKIMKAVSRTGRYRHITTKFQDSSKIAQKSKALDLREKLIEAFLQSQSLSIRKVVDFTIDRVTSAVVKDFQVKYLLTIRKQAKLRVEEMSSLRNDVDLLMKNMVEIYQQSLQQLQKEWDDSVAENTRRRVQGAFDALMPIETLEDVKRTLINVTIGKVHEKLQDWRTTNMTSIAIFSKDIQLDAVKLVENDGSQLIGNKRTSQSIVIDGYARYMPSENLKTFQTLLHYASLQPQRLNDDDLKRWLIEIVEVLNNQILPSNAYRNVAYYSLQLALLIVNNRPDLITQDFLINLSALWHHKKLTAFTTVSETLQQLPKNRTKVNDFIFGGVISSRLIVMIQGRGRKIYEAYSDFLVALVKEKFITIEHINEMSVALYKHEWSKQTLDDIAYFIQRITANLPAAKGNSESHLFMELVADIAREMENF